MSSEAPEILRSRRAQGLDRNPLTQSTRKCEHPGCDRKFVPEVYGLDAYYCEVHRVSWTIDLQSFTVRAGTSEEARVVALNKIRADPGIVQIDQVNEDS